ncbi:I78 family peptidase inhibitor [Microvirga calopogonii]|uniref:I78 family peptidase inhibitor n=1 Tax=Microvirga calopogonii TaxID=2078013 RepID=UPI000E0D2108|nr:I78 family peptidase inhibitor [Microvirga calopogonii]
MSVRVIRFLAVLLTALGLIPAEGFTQPAPDRQTCATGEAQAVIGQPYSPELAERARRIAGARELQKIEPGGAYTTDPNADRLNIEVDRAGIMTGLRCG